MLRFRVLTAAVVLAICVCGLGVFCVDASPQFDQAGSTTIDSIEPATGFLGWLESFFDWLLSSFADGSCDPSSDPECDQNEGGGSMDPLG